MPLGSVSSTRTAKGRTPDPATQFSVFIPNKLGRMHDVVRALAAQEVHVLALTLLDTTDSTIIRLIVDDPDRARELLTKHAFPFTETKLVVVEIEGERQLGDVLAALLEAELNIHYTYPLLTRPGGKSALAMSLEHPDVAEDALKRHQFAVLYQGDLSR